MRLDATTKVSSVTITSPVIVPCGHVSELVSACASVGELSVAVVISGKSRLPLV